MLLQKVLFNSFQWLSSIQLYIYMYHIFFIHSSVNGHLDWNKITFIFSFSHSRKCIGYIEVMD